MHVIRLRGPWELHCLDSSTAAGSGEPRRVQMPCELAEQLDPDYRGRVCLVRPFNTPTNLDPHERVYLAVAGLSPAAELTLNGVALEKAAPLPSSGSEQATPGGVHELPGETATVRVDITAQLGLHNRLEVTLTAPGAALGEVRLEID